ncbi:unnamed protein product, partial [Mesorhabditis spiculigera]
MVEVVFDGGLWPEPIMHVTQREIAFFDRKRNNPVYEVINKLGICSAKAQCLKNPITSCDRINATDDPQGVYLHWKKTGEKRSEFQGMLKVGRRSLYLRNRDDVLFNETMLCVLDFYVCEGERNKGIGKELFDKMLEEEDVQPYQIAYDNPSKMLVAFLKKHYNLDDPIKQSTGLLVFDPIFEDKAPYEPTSSRSISRMTSPSRRMSEMVGVNEKGHLSAGTIIHGDAPENLRIEYDPDTPIGMKHHRDLGHTPLWMKLKYQGQLLPQQVGAARVCAIAATPNGSKVAVATSDRAIVLFDEKGEQRERFATKAIDAKFGKKSYAIRSVCFSPDSTQLAVGQSDHVVYVYKLGASWAEKKVIVNKLLQTASISALSWPFEDKLLIGLTDGKVRIGLIKSNKCSSLYKTEQPVVSLATNPRKTAFVSGHFDGSIILFIFASKSQSKICTHQVTPYSLVFTAHGLLVAGSDRRIYAYTENGVVQQQWDFSDEHEKEFSAICRDPTGTNAVVGSYNKLRLFSYNLRRGAWDEDAPLVINNMYTITALEWKGDGSAVYSGTLNGGATTIDCSLKKGIIRSRFETTHVAPSHVILRDISNESKTSIISNKGLQIDDIKVTGKDLFVLAYTASTLIIADTQSGRSSEIDWFSGGNEKFYFDYPNVAVIVNAGEVTVVEYGIDGALGWVRTELGSKHLLSLQVHPDKHGKPIKKIAYLADPTTITIYNFLTSQQEALIDHKNKIDWLELSEGGSRLLFRDKRSRVTLVDLETDVRSSLLNFCSYVQWVPNSDVIVAQSGENLYVWYNPEYPNQPTITQVRGEIEAVLRDNDRTEVIVQESKAKVAYELDNTQIEFAAALESSDFERAVSFLEKTPDQDEAYLMWRRVAYLAMEQGKLLIAQRCFAAMGDETIKMAKDAAKSIGGDGSAHYKVRANIARINKKFKEAEKIYLEQNDIDEAIGMYKSLHKWEDALELARARNYPGYEQLRISYHRALAETGQEAKVAELKATEGDPRSAIQLFLKSNQPTKALAVLTSKEDLIRDSIMVEDIATALLKNRFFEKAGDLYEKTKDFEKAFESFVEGKAYQKAIQIARFAFPDRVVGIEEEWGNHLVAQGQPEAAINHFLEANCTEKAVEAAIKAKEWSKAVQIVDVIQDTERSHTYYGQIAEHYASIGEFDRAERLFIEANLQKQAIAMYIKGSRWADAYRLSEEFLGKEETAQMYDRKAEELEEQGRLAEAEQLYISIGMSNKAIQMYKKANRNEEVVRLVGQYHSEHLLETHKRLGEEHEAAGDLKGAEEEFLKAGEYKMAIDMYRKAEQWSDAYRLAKTEGGDTIQKQVGFLWAKSLGGDAAVKLLTRFNMLSDAIDFAIENGAFDFAFDLAKLGMKERLPEVHTRIAVQMEEEGRLEEAAKHYIEGGKAEEAVAMFIHDQDWTNAEKIANAGRPDIIMRYFKEQAMWPDALRIAKEYLPNQLSSLQEEFDKEELRSGARGVESFLAQGREWEQNGEYYRAVQAFLKISPEMTTDTELVRQSALKAADIGMRFLIGGNGQEIFSEILQRLSEVGEHEKTAELLLALGNTADAIHALCEAQQWGKARQVANEFMPEALAEIDAAYKNSLKSEGRLGELIDVDAISAIDLLIERGQWEKAIETAKQQKHGPLLDKYVAMYASHLISEGDYVKASKLFERYGAAGNEENFNIYKTLFDSVVGVRTDNPEEEYERIALIRNVYQQIVRGLENGNSRHFDFFYRQMLALHMMCIRNAMLIADELESKRTRLKLSIALLRYSDVLPPDRVFYEAGILARDVGTEYEGCAFLFLNHYLDLHEAIEDGSPDMVDFAPFEGTEIPTEVTIPEKTFLDGPEHEEIKEWVLAISVDDSANKNLITDRRGCFEANLEHNGEEKPMDIITGYPILNSIVDVGNNVYADKEELNRYMIALRKNPTDQLQDVSNFISKLAKSSLGLQL